MASDKDPEGKESRSRRTNFSLESLLNSRAGQTLSKAVGQSGNILEMLLKAPEYMEQIGKAGRYLKDLRQVTGLTLEDLSKAVDIESPDILRAVEEGRSPVTLDILFRLASFYSRNDPVTFMVNFSREYAPWLWQILRVTGVEKFLITLERELKFINIYRSRESARQLSNENFDKMLEFVRGSFDMAMDFIEPLETEQPARQKSRTTAKSQATDKKEQSGRARSKTAGTTAKSARSRQPQSRKAPQKKTAETATKRRTPRTSGTKKEG